MKITNKSKLPIAFVRMAESEYQPTPNRFSITTLLKPTREIILTRRHFDKLEADASDMIWSLFGQAVHHILEKNADDKDGAEMRLEYTFPKGHELEGLTVSGIMDFYDKETKTVIDYKTCSIWKVRFNDFSDWEKQGDGYAWLLERNGLEVAKSKFYAIMRDWSVGEARRKGDYPQSQVLEVEFVADSLKADNWIQEKLLDIKYNENTPDNDLPLCSKEDRWAKPDKFAVMKKGRKSALRLLDSSQEARDWMDNNSGDYIEFRKGEDTKCIYYCSVCKFCDYWQKNYADMEVKEDV